MTAWFDKRIKKEDLDRMDEEFARNYGNVRVMSAEEYETETKKIIEEEEEEKQEEEEIYDEEENDVVDYDESAEEIPTEESY